MKKQTVLLGLREKWEKLFNGMLDDMLSKFKNKQEIFRGHNNTYDAVGEFADDPTKRSMVKVASTVGQQLDWFRGHTAEYFDTVLSIEKTNAMGIKAPLIVDGESWGEYYTLELLRMKSILDGKLKLMFKELPIRDEKRHWIPTTNADLYKDMEVYETSIVVNFIPTTLKSTVVVEDPYVKDAPNRPPVTAQIDRRVNVGKETRQNFSGEITNLQRAQYEVRIDKLYTGIIEALETANNVEAQESDLGKKFLDYLFK